MIYPLITNSVLCEGHNDGIYRTNMSLDGLTSYSYTIVRDGLVVQRNDYYDGRLVRVLQFNGSNMHGIQRTFVYNGRRPIVVTRVYLNGVNITDYARDEGINLSTIQESDFIFLRLKYE